MLSQAVDRDYTARSDNWHLLGLLLHEARHLSLDRLRNRVPSVTVRTCSLDLFGEVEIAFLPGRSMSCCVARNDAMDRLRESLRGFRPRMAGESRGKQERHIYGARGLRDSDVEQHMRRFRITS